MGFEIFPGESQQPANLRVSIFYFLSDRIEFPGSTVQGANQNRRKDFTILKMRPELAQELTRP